MTNKVHSVFYSWQSDLDKKATRNFIEKAINKALKELKEKKALTFNAIIDRDTQGLTGSPNIAESIFNKIENADVFVCDVTIVGRIKNPDDPSLERSTSNPNVNYELGYASKHLGNNRVILVFNEAYGDKNLLPFDLNQRRLVIYNLKPGSSNQDMFDYIVGRLKSEIKEILYELEKNDSTGIDPSPSYIIVNNCIVNRNTNQRSLVKKYMKEVSAEIKKLNPSFRNSNIYDEELFIGIDNSKELVNNFSKVAECAAENNSLEACISLYKGFSEILNLYSPDISIESTFNTFDFDLAKYLGRDLLTILFSFLIQEDRWEIIGTLLNQKIYAVDPETYERKLLPFYRISDQVILMDYRKNRIKSNLFSIYASHLKDRLSKDKAISNLSFECYQDSDLLLYLVGESQKDFHTSLLERIAWYPYSVIYLTHIPQFLQECESAAFSMNLFSLVNVTSIDDLKTKLNEYFVRLNNNAWKNIVNISYPMGDFEINKIGSI